MAKKIQLPDDPNPDDNPDVTEPLLPPAASSEEIAATEKQTADEKAAQIIRDINAKNAEAARVQLEANAAAKKAFGPVPIVELDEVIASESLTPEELGNQVTFWIGELGVLTFPDKTTYHARDHRVTTGDPELIAKLEAMSASNPTAKIFKQ